MLTSAPGQCKFPGPGQPADPFPDLLLIESSKPEQEGRPAKAGILHSGAAFFTGTSVLIKRIPVCTIRDPA